MTARYGITFPRLLFAAAAGVVLGAVPVGYVTMVAVAAAQPARLVVVPVMAGLGAVLGRMLARRTRAATRPTMRGHVRTFTAVGALVLPGAAFLGQFDHVFANTAAGSAVGGAFMASGTAGIVVYYRRRRRIARQSARRSTATASMSR
ncbi:hypothetical protein [Amycolatopsis ultiminotia]|uniref:hypothetical protein n=1 Tax=Amycolatopsis ultiminotia TaxID=543629 RepID=UPI0031EABCB5